MPASVSHFSSCSQPPPPLNYFALQVLSAFEFLDTLSMSFVTSHLPGAQHPLVAGDSGASGSAGERSMIVWVCADVRCACHCIRCTNVAKIFQTVVLPASYAPMDARAVVYWEAPASMCWSSSSAWLLRTRATQTPEVAGCRQVVLSVKVVRLLLLLCSGHFGLAQVQMPWLGSC